MKPLFVILGRIPDFLVFALVMGLSALAGSPAVMAAPGAVVAAVSGVSPSGVVAAPGGEFVALSDVSPSGGAVAMGEPGDGDEEAGAALSPGWPCCRWQAALIDPGDDESEGGTLDVGSG